MTNDLPLLEAIVKALKQRLNYTPEHLMDFAREILDEIKKVRNA